MEYRYGVVWNRDRGGDCPCRYEIIKVKKWHAEENPKGVANYGLVESWTVTLAQAKSILASKLRVHAETARRLQRGVGSIRVAHVTVYDDWG
jgi:uncharacterized protein with NAD-binding domain and iron-sulfur cluster|tara:strand:- start:335 stop:610 length:276 start_codon:yes stop_codon:yes gene_type:complete